MKKKTNAFNIVYDFMQNYNNLKYNQSIEIDPNVTDPVVIAELIKAQTKTKMVMATITKAIAETEKEYKAKSKELYTRVFSQYFVFEKTYEEIAEQENISEKTARKYITEIIQNLAVKIFGVEALEQ